MIFSLVALPTAAWAVIGGVPDASTMRHTVMVLSKKGSICSGALVAPNFVLTAAHCVTDGSDNAVHVRDSSGRPIVMMVSEKRLHPNYVPDAIAKRVRSVDLAILKFDEALPPAFVPVSLSNAMPRAGESVTLAGYGMTDETKRNSTGQFRSVRQSVIEPYGPSKILLWLKGDTFGGSDLLRGGCHGDSGGPIFYQDKLVAITSWTTGTKGRDCGEMTQGALIAPQRSWIDSVIE